MLSFPLLVGAVVFLLLTGLGLILWLGRAARRLESQIARLRTQLEIKERTLAQQGKSLSDLKQEATVLSRLMVVLPDLARHLSLARTTRELEESILTLAQQLLDAREVSLFTVEQETLVLKVHRGLSPETAAAAQRIPIGAGRIGWTAEKRVIMTAGDFENESNLVRDQMSRGPSPPIRTDLCAPLIHRDRFYGVLNAGRVDANPESARRLIGLITHLGVIALENVLLLDEIQQQADLDGLTTLYNVTYLYKYLDREIWKAQRYDRPITVVIFDLDHFEPFNRMFGRAEGDNVLRIVARLIKDGLRTIDIPCRYGGEEMVVILPETDREKGMYVAERTRRAVEAHPFSLKKVTLSGGLVVYPSDGRESNELLKKAEVALEQAKRSGRNRIAAYSNAPRAP